MSDSTYLPFVSVIIICEQFNDFLKESLPYYEQLNYPEFEVLVFTTEQVLVADKYPHIKFIADPKTKNKPAEKRDLAIKHAKGEIFAFIDDDAFPSKDWLKNAVSYFENPSIAAVGGPGVTPESAGIFEEASGWVTASPLGGYGLSYRFLPEEKREVDDFPSMNLIVRAEDFKAIGGFDSAFYPGEDTKLCLDLTKKLNKKIMYDPEVLVYHHKRPLFKKHLLQNGRFGLHRGHFARVLPETSRRLMYFIPSLFFIGNVFGLFILSLNFFFTDNATLNLLTYIYLSVIGLYIVALIFNSIWVYQKTFNGFITTLSFFGVASTHLWYGIKFLQGFLFTKEVKDDYGRSE